MTGGEARRIERGQGGIGALHTCVPIISVFVHRTPPWLSTTSTAWQHLVADLNITSSSFHKRKKKGRLPNAASQSNRGPGTRRVRSNHRTGRRAGHRRSGDLWACYLEPLDEPRQQRLIRAFGTSGGAAPVSGPPLLSANAR